MLRHMEPDTRPERLCDAMAMRLHALSAYLVHLYYRDDDDIGCRGDLSHIHDPVVPE